MNIAIYTHYFFPEIGAPSARILDLGTEWVRQGHDVQVITCLPNHPRGELYPGYEKHWYVSETIAGMRIHRHLTYFARNQGFVRRLVGHVSFLPGATLLSNRHLRPPDIVIGTSPTFFAAMAAAWTAYRFRVPFIMEIRDLWPAIFVDLGLIRNPWIIRALEMWEMWLYRVAVKLVTVTESFKRILVKRGIPENKIYKITNGADTEFWKPTEERLHARTKLNLNLEHFVVLYVGAHGISHSLRTVLDTAELLREHENIRFILIGDGAEKPQLVEAARSRSLSNLEFRDPVDKETVRRFYTASDICLVHLRNIPLFDTFIPSKIFEILSMGRPIVGGLRGEAAEILTKSNAAIVAQPEDADAMKNAILSLEQDRASLALLGNKGRAFVEANYSRVSQAKTYDLIMQETLKCGRLEQIL